MISDACDTATNWRSAVDTNSGKTYWYNKLTRESTWTKPSHLQNESPINLNPRKKLGNPTSPSRWFIDELVIAQYIENPCELVSMLSDTSKDIRRESLQILFSICVPVMSFCLAEVNDTIPNLVLTVLQSSSASYRRISLRCLCTIAATSNCGQFFVLHQEWISILDILSNWRDMESGILYSMLICLLLPTSTYSLIQATDMEYILCSWMEIVLTSDQTIELDSLISHPSNEGLSLLDASIITSLCSSARNGSDLAGWLLCTLITHSFRSERHMELIIKAGAISCLQLMLMSSHTVSMSLQEYSRDLLLFSLSASASVRERLLDSWMSFAEDMTLLVLHHSSTATTIPPQYGTTTTTAIATPITIDTTTSTTTTATTTATTTTTTAVSKVIDMNILSSLTCQEVPNNPSLSNTTPRRRPLNDCGGATEIPFLGSNGAIDKDDVKCSIGHSNSIKEIFLSNIVRWSYSSHTSNSSNSTMGTTEVVQDVVNGRSWNISGSLIWARCPAIRSLFATGNHTITDNMLSPLSVTLSDCHRTVLTISKSTGNLSTTSRPPPLSTPLSLKGVSTTSSLYSHYYSSPITLTTHTTPEVLSSLIQYLTTSIIESASMSLFDQIELYNCAKELGLLLLCDILVDSLMILVQGRNNVENFDDILLFAQANGIIKLENMVQELLAVGLSSVAQLANNSKGGTSWPDESEVSYDVNRNSNSSPPSRTRMMPEDNNCSLVTSPVVKQNNMSETSSLASIHSNASTNTTTIINTNSNKPSTRTIIPIASDAAIEQPRLAAVVEEQDNEIISDKICQPIGQIHSSRGEGQSHDYEMVGEEDESITALLQGLGLDDSWVEAAANNVQPLPGGIYSVLLKSLSQDSLPLSEDRKAAVSSAEREETVDIASREIDYDHDNGELTIGSATVAAATKPSSENASNGYFNGCHRSNNLHNNNKSNSNTVTNKAAGGNRYLDNPDIQLFNTTSTKTTTTTTARNLIHDPKSTSVPKDGWKTNNGNRGNSRSVSQSQTERQRRRRVEAVERTRKLYMKQPDDFGIQVGENLFICSEYEPGEEQDHNQENLKWKSNSNSNSNTSQIKSTRNQSSSSSSSRVRPSTTSLHNTTVKSGNKPMEQNSIQKRRQPTKLGTENENENTMDKVQQAVLTQLQIARNSKRSNRHNLYQQHQIEPSNAEVRNINNCTVPVVVTNPVLMEMKASLKSGGNKPFNPAMATKQDHEVTADQSKSLKFVSEYEITEPLSQLMKPPNSMGTVATSCSSMVPGFNTTNTATTNTIEGYFTLSLPDNISDYQNIIESKCNKSDSNSNSNSNRNSNSNSSFNNNSNEPSTTECTSSSSSHVDPVKSALTLLKKRATRSNQQLQSSSSSSRSTLTGAQNPNQRSNDHITTITGGGVTERGSAMVSDAGPSTGDTIVDNILQSNVQRSEKRNSNVPNNLAISNAIEPYNSIISPSTEKSLNSATMSMSMSMSASLSRLKAKRGGKATSTSASLSSTISKSTSADVDHITQPPTTTSNYHPHLLSPPQLQLPLASAPIRSKLAVADIKRVCSRGTGCQCIFCSAPVTSSLPLPPVPSERDEEPLTLLKTETMSMAVTSIHKIPRPVAQTKKLLSRLYFNQSKLNKLSSSSVRLSHNDSASKSSSKWREQSKQLRMALRK